MSGIKQEIKPAQDFVKLAQLSDSKMVYKVLSTGPATRHIVPGVTVILTVHADIVFTDTDEKTGNNIYLVRESDIAGYVL